MSKYMNAYKLTFIRCAFILFFSLVSVGTQASQCLSNGASVDARYGFCITANLISNGSNRIRIENDNYYHPIWTDDVVFFNYGQGINETDYLNDGKEHQFQVKFVRTDNSRNLQGWLEYSVDGVRIASKDQYINIRNTIGADKFSPYINVRVLGDTITGTCLAEGNCGRLPIPLPKPEYNENAQFEFGSATCSSSSCSFPLTKDYQYTPVVILMPTIGKQGAGENGTNPDSDAPASAFLKSVDINAKQVSFEIKRPTMTGVRANQMVQVDYLVVEPGTADFNGHTVVAGYVDTNKQVYKSGPGKSNDSAWSAGTFSDFGLNNAFSSNPVVLTQIQSEKNDKWLTAAIRNQSRTSQVTPKQGLEVSLELSRSRSDSHQYQTERIGYIATLAGDGKVDGYKFNFGKLTTPNVTNNQPLEQGCSTLHDLGLNSVSSVVAKKMERNGAHGGWLRRCRLDGNKASFVVDEDDWDRSHLPEEVGYFSSELDYVFPEYCEYFKGSAQSFSANGDIKIQTKAFILGQQENFKLGFGSINDDSNGGGLGGKSCRTVNKAWECQLDSSLIVPSMDLPSFPGGGGSESLYDGTTHTIAPGKYTSIEAGSTTKLIFSEGEYWVRRLTLNGSATLDIKQGDKVTLYVENLQTNTNSGINHAGSADDFLLLGVGGNANIHLTGTTQFNGLVYSENKVTLDSKFDSNDDISQMPATIVGAVTAKNLVMNSTSNIRGSSICFAPPEQDYQIIVAPEQDLSLTCDRQPVEFQVQNENGAPAGNYDGQVSVTSSLSTANKAFWYLSEQGGEDSKLDVRQSHAFNTDGNGKVTLWLKSDVVGTIAATGTLSTDSRQVAVGQYGFVPFKFEITDSYLPVVAGKPVGISIKAKACKTGDSDEVSVGYDGKRKLKFSTAYSAPNTGNKKVELRASAASSDWLNDEIELDFNQGIATAELRYLDAGKTVLTIYDPKCSLVEGCEILPDSKALLQYDIGDWTRLEGKQSIWSRPYTFALCNYGSSLVENASGSSTKGNGFIPAGQTFQLKVKPVIWADDDRGNNDINNGQNATAPVDTSGMCNRLDTPNFYANGAPTATVALSIPFGEGVKPHSPDKDGAKSGSLTSTSLSNQQIKDTAFSASWNEVGSIWLQADTQAKYLDMDVNLGRRPVGRFYPAYVEIQSGNTFVYPKVDDENAQNDFAYLGQEFNTTFSVLPKSQTGGIVSNYALFEEDYQVQLALQAIDNSNNSFGSRLPPKGSWRGWSNTTTSMIWKLERQGFGSGSTTRESPWNSANSQWGLYIAKGVDSTTIRSSEREATTAATNVVVKGSQATQEMAPFAATPELRYGRMRLEDVTVPVSQDAEVPVIVEYYLNSNVEFITNDDDGASLFGSNYGCSQLIFPDAMRSVLESTPASDSINNGEGRLRVTHPQGEGVTDGYREQIRLGQRLSSAIPSCTPLGSVETSNQPWLQFNWTGLGDENPSAVVTFGVYRGNDRIIYRGEKGMNQLLN